MYHFQNKNLHMTNSHLYKACIADVDDGAFRLFVYAYAKDASISSLNYKEVCQDLNISTRTFYRYKSSLESLPDLFLKTDDFKKPNDSVVVKQFDEFYEQYPRKKARRSAEKSFASAIKRGTHPYVIINAAKQYAELVNEKNTERKYIPFPATWLNQERWKDEDLQAHTELHTDEDLAPKIL